MGATFDFDRTAHQLESLLRGALDRLPPDTAAVERHEFPSSDPARVSLSLVPTRPGASQITIYVVSDAPEVYVLVGEAGLFEIPPGGRYTDSEQLGEVRAFVDAVVAGDLVETVWRRGKAIGTTRCRIVLAGREVTNVGAGTAGMSLRRRRKEEIRWKPYSG